ncbi:FUSC family protein [Azospirillum sp. YIM B02556]|uniref:FUSC family protein n=1 Tax=Azospirillum endophyticum TaxID=2800326 RepID=A0ABS1FAI9_9PROT|nr:FUSC family protein [Azospirillum endophyticum]MBK1840441.1 FUSC family protein [Azospirillum endophyticum]
MRTEPPSNRLFAVAGIAIRIAALGRAWSLPSRMPVLRADVDALLFSAKSFAAAMLAYYIALRAGVPKPSWAIVTVYIVSQNSAGASLSRGVYRFVGTVVGAVATVAIIPAFVNEPIVCSVVLACWIGLCLYLSLLDRTARAYAFVLSGYTASLIGFPGVFNPAAIFDTASVRVQEISIGILCAVLVHRFVLPKRMTGQFTAKLSATLRDARRLAGDALRGSSGQETRRDRDRLAGDLLALQGLAGHLPYDPVPVTPSRETLQLIHDRLARLLPLATEVEDRIHALRAGGHPVPEELAALLDGVERWLSAAADADAAGRDAGAVRLLDHARTVRTRIAAQAATAGDRLAANLAGHLAETIGLLHECDRLERNLARAAARPPDAASHLRSGRATGYVYHRDPWMAARAALGAAAGIVIGCAFWIWSAWPEGGMAVSILGVCCALFGNVDTPAPNVVKYMAGSVVGVAVSLVYSFVILPRVGDFAGLVAVLAPAFLVAGSLQARPPTTFMALGITLTIPILSGLGATYAGDFAGSLNSVVALFAATGFAVVSMSLFQTIPVDAAIGRLLRLNRRDVRRRALGGGPDEAHWTSLMIDRTALLLPRLRLSGTSHPDVLDDTLHHLRVGHAAGRLHQAIRQVDAKGGAGEDGRIGNDGLELLTAIARHFGPGYRAEPSDAVALHRRIDTLMARIAESSTADRVRLLDLLIDLRFALDPGRALTWETDR